MVMDAKTSESGSRELKTETMSVASEVTGKEAIPEINPEELFTDRDLLNSPELTGATELTVTDGSDIVIDQEGTYVLSGSAENATILVEAGSDDKVQLVLKGLSITNSDSPIIYQYISDCRFSSSFQCDPSRFPEYCSSTSSNHIRESWQGRIHSAYSDQ